MEARWGYPEGYPRAVYEQAARDVVDELARGQHHLYARLGRRWGLKPSGARKRVFRTVELGLLEWMGEPHAPHARLPGQPAPPTDWERGYEHLIEYVESQGSANIPQGWQSRDGFPLWEWLRAQRKRNYRGRLSPERIKAITDLLPHWLGS